MSNSLDEYLFIHVPKTAGTSLLDVFRQALGPDEISPAAGGNFDKIDIAAFGHYRMVIGHFRRQQLAHFPNRKLLTFLRDPVDQVLSKYYFYRNMVDSDDPVIALCQQYSLEELLASVRFEGAGSFSNSVTRQFAGAGLRVLTPNGEAFNTAIRTLEACEFIGIFEDMADSLDLMSYTFGWPPADEMPNKNVTRGRKLVAEHDSATIRRIREINEPDIDLYQYARQLFFTRKRAMMRAAVCRQMKPTAAIASSQCAEPLRPPIRRPVRCQPGISAEDPTAAVRIVAVNVTGATSVTSAIRSGDLVEIAVTLVANATVDSLSVSFHICNEYGQLLSSSRTQSYDRNLSVTAGNTYRVAFSLQMKLAPGRYSVSAGATSGRPGKRILHHYIDDEVSFDLQPGLQGHFLGLVDLYQDVAVQPNPNFAETYPLGETVRFSSDGSSDRYARTGWAASENWGRWTIRDEAHLLMRLDRQPEGRLFMDVVLLPYCPLQHSDLKVEVLINGHQADCWLFTAPQGIEHRQTLVSAELLREVNHILFRIREPRVPADLGDSTDTRALGVGLIELRLSEHSC